MQNEDVIPLDGNTQDTARWIWKNLVPKSGQADSVQGEALRAIEKLRWEAQENGNINWDDRFQMFIDFLRQTLCSEESFSKASKNSVIADLDRLQNFLPPNELKDRSQAHQLPYVDDDLYDRLTEHLVAFCQQHPRVIPREKDPNQYR
jgi:hypothetical protein